MKTYFVIISSLLLIVGCESSPEKTKKIVLPVIGEKKLAGSDAKDTIYHTVQPFSFVNQYHDTVTEKND